MFGGGVLLLPSPRDSCTIIVTYHETTQSSALTDDLGISDSMPTRTVAGENMLDKQLE